jgi:hypothetical protein
MEENRFFLAFSKALAMNVPEGQPPILYKYKTPERKIAEEAKATKDLRRK